MAQKLVGRWTLSELYSSNSDLLALSAPFLSVFFKDPLKHKLAVTIDSSLEAHDDPHNPTQVRFQCRPIVPPILRALHSYILLTYHL